MALSMRRLPPATTASTWAVRLRRLVRLIRALVRIAIALALDRSEEMIRMIAMAISIVQQESRDIEIERTEIVIVIATVTVTAIVITAVAALGAAVPLEGSATMIAAVAGIGPLRLPLRHRRPRLLLRAPNRDLDRRLPPAPVVTNTLNRIKSL